MLIGWTKLLCKHATVSAMLHGASREKVAPHLLQFTTAARPIVVWNVTRRCNLSCKHCYIDARSDFSDELSSEQARAFIEDLGRMEVPVLLLSGGEPLMREDIYKLAEWAGEAGVRPILSSNGTLITPDVARRLRDAGVQYVGISLDGLERTHDEFRGEPGSFQRAVEGLDNAKAAGLKTGVRFTVNADNYRDLGPLLDFVVQLGVPRFCMYHLVYAGRAGRSVHRDLTAEQKREVIGLIIERVLQYRQAGVELEVLTVDCPTDAVVLHSYVAEHDPQRADEVRELLRRHQGCSAGVKIANVDHEGNVHPCQFWGHESLGNVAERPFSAIWSDESNPLLQRLRNRNEYLKGRCGRCVHQDICGGCRVRAYAVAGDVWGEDPACYLSDEQIEARPTAACVGGDS